MERLEGRLKSANTIFKQGIIAYQNRMRQIDAGMRAVAVQLQAIENRVDVIATPPTRKEIEEIFIRAVAKEVNKKAPTFKALKNKLIFVLNQVDCLS